MAYQITDNLIPVNRYSRPGTHLVGVKGLVIHWTANTGQGADAMANSRYFTNLSNQSGDSATFASAHYNVDDHSIVRNLPENEMGYHVGATTYNKNTLNLLDTTYPNNCTIGIEWCVNSGNDFNETWKRVGWLAASICIRYGLDPLTHMIRHYDVTYKDCPHFFTPNTPNGEDGWAQFRSYVNQLVANGGEETPAAPAERYEVYCKDRFIIDYDNFNDARWAADQWYQASVRLKSNGNWVYSNMDQPFQFRDTQDHWAKDDIALLDSLGLLSHPDDKCFNPDKQLTRAEMATLLARVIRDVQSGVIKKV